ncbi:tRNAHis guanylyltransferase [Seminavis robusta]|uniref:tRNAHis guanylyltransferase n=1 Tax=Seminavis robusta TaxID=568900 RepID=A0A9N8H2Z6_9STRA|nr:tRNAHis guanylyltransferase [Seminavis robusta]|eukprot:Sro76_g041760.1 tRNAHis guanylyltransferase (339) ;mRNA; f:104803-105819
MNNNTGNEEPTDKVDGKKTTPTMAEAALRLQTQLKESVPPRWDSVPFDLHPLAPFVAKPEWTMLGDAIKKAEQPNQEYTHHIPGEKWISLRCDGTGFSKFTRHLQKLGVFSKGHSPEFAAIMKACCEGLMTKFVAHCGYTQSDEMTVLVAPTSIVRGERQPHMYNGRLQKLCSLAAATVTARFNYELMALCAGKKEVDTMAVLQSLPTFDCRVGVYGTKEQAISLILWRSYDCGINATSDAVFKCGVLGSKQIVKLPTKQRLEWLYQQSLLPLSPHQRDGTFLVKRKRVVSGVDQKTGEPISYLRGRIEQVEGNILQLFKDGALFPPDDILDVGEQRA